MNLLKNFEIIDKALVYKSNLIISDIHIGYEEALNKQGFLVPRIDFKEYIGNIDKILKKAKKIETIIINGDLKHEFGTISEQEWRYTLKFIDYLSSKCRKLILVKGNHDMILGPIARKRNIGVVDHFIITSQLKDSDIKHHHPKNPICQKLKISEHDQKSIRFLTNIKNLKIFKKIHKKLITNEKIENILKNKSNKDILVIHGDKLPKKELLKGIKTIVIGHEHPAVSLKDGPRVETFKCFLAGKWKNKDLIVLPSFNLFNEGHDIMKEDNLSPFLDNGFDDFKVYVVADKVYEFGKVKNL